MSDQARQFGRAYARAMRGGSGDKNLQAQKRALTLAVRSAQQPRERRVAWNAAWALTFAGSVAAVTLWLSNDARQPTLSAQIAQTQVGAGETLQIVDETTLSFSEGSRVDFSEASKVRLAALQPEHAHVVLENGQLKAKITKETGVKWTFAAGPYRVLVVGTAFDVEWGADSGHFRVAVSEGRVRVEGAGLGGGVSLGAGDALERHNPLPDAETEVTDRANDEAVADERVDVVSDETVVEPSARRNETPSRKLDPVQSSAPARDWKGLARARQHRNAFAAAKKMGFAQLCGSLGSEDLILLANVARYAGSSSDARQAYAAVRKRFPASAAALLAAFSLGRLAADNEGHNSEAQQWFRVYLREAPNGSLAEGARAQLLKLRLAAGDRRGAERAAADYLRHHPDGPRAESARELAPAP